MFYTTQMGSNVKVRCCLKVSDRFQAPAALTPGENLKFLLSRKMGKMQSPLALTKTKVPAPAGNKNKTVLTVATYGTQLSRPIEGTEEYIENRMWLRILTTCLIRSRCANHYSLPENGNR
jgi:hypothetical protein